MAITTTTDVDYTTPSDGYSVIRRISWGAIFAGAAVALVTQLILNLLGVGIGASVLDPAEGDTIGKGLGWGSALWVVLSTVLALFAGGWVAGRLSGFIKPLYRGLHGLVAFSVVTLLTFYMLTTAVGNVISGTTNFLGNAMSAATAGAEAGTDVFARVATGQSSGTGHDQKATAVAEDAAEGIAGASFSAFLALVLGGTAAVFGAMMGNPDPRAGRSETVTANHKRHD